MNEDLAMHRRRGQPSAVGAERQSEDEVGVVPHGQNLLPGHRVPEPDRRVIACGGETSVVGAEREAPDGTIVPPQAAEFVSCVGVPELDLAAAPVGHLAAARGQPAAVMAEDDLVYGTVMPAQGLNRSPGR